MVNKKSPLRKQNKEGKNILEEPEKIHETEAENLQTVQDQESSPNKNGFLKLIDNQEGIEQNSEGNDLTNNLQLTKNEDNDQNQNNQ